MAEARDEKTKAVQTGNFFERNEKVLTYTLGGLIVAGLGIFAYLKFHHEPKEVESQESWAQSFDYMEMDSLDLALEGGPTSVGLLSIADKYDGYSGGNVSQLLAARAYLRKGDVDQAIQHYLEVEFEDHILASMAAGELGDAYSEAKQYDAAVEQYMEAAELNPNPLTTPYWLKKAGIHFEELGQNDKALEAYEQIRNEYPNSKQGRDIEKFIARLKK